MIAALQDEGAPLKVDDIKRCANLRTRNATDILLGKMAKDGDIVRVKRGWYDLPGRGGQIGQKERSSTEDADFVGQNSNLSNLSDLSNVDDPTESTAHNGAPTLSSTSDPYLEIPAFLKRH